MPKVTYVAADGTSHDVEVPVGTSLMEGAVSNGIPGIDAICGGACACATCHVRVDDAWLERLNQPDATEKEMLEFAVDVGRGSRLSCQIEMTASLAGLVVHLPKAQR